MATISKVSKKYKDIISKSTLIHSGCPALYQLRPKIKRFRKLTRKTVGEKSLDKENKTILLVGETGTGKSTLINALVNYAMGVKFEDDIWFQIGEIEKRSQSESQTSDVVVYEIFGFEGQTLPFSLTIVDTPGYGDTKKVEHDLIVSERLFDLFRSEEGVHELSAVGLVMKASENRVSDRLMYIFNSVMSLFGNDMEKNIVALLTHSTGRKPKNVLEALHAADIKCARDEKNEPVHFLFDNCQHEDRTEEREILEQAGKVTLRGISQFKDFLENTAPQKLEKTVEVLNEHVRLKACIQNLQKRIKYFDLKQTKEAQKKQEDKIRGGKWVLFYEGAVTCKVCEEKCHYPCTVVCRALVCDVMKNHLCTVCTRKCPISDHVKEDWIYVNKTRTVEKALQDKKYQYEQNKTESEKKLSLLEILEKEMEDQCLEEAYQHVVKLAHIALNVDSVSIHIHLDFLIKKMNEKGDTEKVQKLEEMRSQLDEKKHSGIQYGYDRVCKLFKNNSARNTKM